jgi:hypothetical protein
VRCCKLSGEWCAWGLWLMTWDELCKVFERIKLSVFMSNTLTMHDRVIIQNECL